MNEKYPEYYLYGGRGICVCDRWLKFENFIADIGKKPSKEYSIDRIDPNGNYEPKNCRWADRITQSRNKRSSRFVSYRGEVMNATDYANAVGIKPGTIHMRMVRKFGKDTSQILEISEERAQRVID
jgi:hypothetical protein